MANRLVVKNNIRKYQKKLNSESSKLVQISKNPEADANVLGGKIVASNHNLETENLLPEYNDLQYQNVYAIAREPDVLFGKELLLTSPYFELPYDYVFSSVEYTSFKQFYRFNAGNSVKEAEENLKIMRDTPKVVFSSQSQPFYSKYHKTFNSYKIYLFAPELYSQNAPELKQKNLPVLYVLNIISQKNNPNIFRITMQAVVSGRQDGLFNLMILDKENFDDENSMKKHTRLSVRNAHNVKDIKLENVNNSEYLGPEYDSLENAVKYVLDKLNIKYSMKSTLSNEKVLNTCEEFVNKDGYLDILDNRIKKIDVTTVLNSLSTYKKEQPVYHRSRIINECYVLTDENGRVKNSLTLKISTSRKQNTDKQQ